MTPSFACVVLTRGNRPDDLNLSLESLLRQRDVDLDVVVVGNGWEPEGLPAGVRGAGLAEDRGIPAGRNAGVPHARGDLLFFLDDDASLAEDDALKRVADELRDPAVGLVQLRVDPRGPGHAPRDWVPRLRATNRATGDVTAVWEGAVGMPRRVFDEIGGWPGEFRFVHEGVDLAWRVMDAGYRVRYLGDVAVLHPPPPPIPAPERHGYSYYFGARNRVWLARRYLPLPLGAIYVATFAARTAVGIRSPRHARAAARGYRDGFRDDCGGRRRLRVRTLWRMVRAGRPPLI